MLPARRLGVHRRGDERPVAGRPGRPLQGGRRAGEDPPRASVGHPADLVGPIGLGVVDDHGSAEPVQELVVLRAGGGHHGCPENARDLHREVPHPARGRGDQDLVPGADRQLVGQPLFGRERVDRRRRRIGDGQPGGDGGQLLDRARDVLRVAAGQAGVPIHGRAVVQGCVGAGVAHHDPGELPAGDVGQRAGPAAGAERGVPRADPGGEHPDEHLAGARLR